MEQFWINFWSSLSANLVILILGGSGYFVFRISKRQVVKSTSKQNNKRGNNKTENYYGPVSNYHYADQEANNTNSKYN